MIVNTEWLLDYLSPRPALADLLTALPRVGLDIEATHLLSRELQDVRIGFIRDKQALSGSEDKYICKVEVAKNDFRQIICASAHPIEVGWGVPVALVGCELPDGTSIREEHFQGVLSQGMICLDGELGLIAKGSGLQVFSDESLLGKSLPEAIPIDEALVDIKVYPNRPDCLGLVGIARELAALLNLRLVLPALAPHGTSSKQVAVDILDADLCTRYTCRIIESVTIAPSPAWLASRLLATGSRPINNVVDITNFVMKEWGQPLHAFDLTRVQEKIVVRRFKENESLKILDGRNVSGQALAICDAKHPLALAGMMGGAASGIQTSTKDVLLEAAHFEATNIRACSKRLQVSSDSAYRFERGMDPNETLDAARERATALLFLIAGAKSAGPVTDTYPVKAERRIFSLPARRVSDYLGIPVTAAQVHDSLTKVGYGTGTGLDEFSVPTRRVDANDPVVLIEDIARVIGYDKIQPQASAETPTRGGTSALDCNRSTARALLTGQGFLELRGVPLEPLATGENFARFEGSPVELLNPLNADLARVRRSLIPFLLNTVELNAKRRVTTFRYFEMDKIFAEQAGEVVEQWSLGIVMGGQLNDTDWSGHRESDYFDLKGVVESLCEALRVPPPVFETGEIAGYTSGTVAQLKIAGESMGVLGQVAPELLAPRKIQGTLFAAELDLGKWTELAARAARFAALPRFPGVFRDLSFVLSRDIPYTEIDAAVRKAAGGHLESMECIDVFAGKGMPEDRRSVAVSMAFRAADRTLASEEIAADVERVIAELSSRFKAELRG